jgi:dTMP kinase
VFITLEGPEGSGKTTQMPLLVSWLSEHGYDVLAVREPGGTRIGDAVRAILLDKAATNMDARAELLLFCSSRAQLVAERIRPHLAANGIVVCDRFADSTLAYQGYARGLDLDLLRTLLRFATYDTTPDLTLFLDIDVEAGLRRKAAHGDSGEWNRLDAETVDFHRRVRAGYQALAAADPQRWAIIRVDAPIDYVQHQIRAAVTSALERFNPTQKSAFGAEYCA